MKNIVNKKLPRKSISKFFQLIIGLVIQAAVIVSSLQASYHVQAQTTPQQKSNYVFLPYVSHGGTIYYVSTSGSDSNQGSITSPWRTLGKAARMVVPGDVVYVRGGVYHEAVDFTKSGTSQEPIIISSYPGESAIIDGNNFTIPGVWGVLLGISGNYIHVSGIEVRYSRGMGVIVRGSFDIVDNVFSHHNKENGILVNGGHSIVIKNCKVWRNSLSNEFGQQGYNSSGLSAARDGVSYVTFRSNMVWENWGEGLSSYEADHITFEDNVIHDNWGNVYISDSTNITFQRNFIYTDPSSYMYPYGYRTGIVMGDETYNPASANITIINNISYGNHGNFWWWQGDQGGGMHNVLIANNTFVNGIGSNNSGEGGIIISTGDHQNVRFENNLVLQDGNLPVIAFDYQTGITFSHNLWSKSPPASASGPGDIIADPLLSKTGSQFSPEWFTLTGLSPAIGVALSIPEVSIDYFYINREVPPDIGASEFFPTP